MNALDRSRWSAALGWGVWLVVGGLCVGGSTRVSSERAAYWMRLAGLALFSVPSWLLLLRGLGSRGSGAQRTLAPYLLFFAFAVAVGIIAGPAPDDLLRHRSRPAWVNALSVASVVSVLASFLGRRMGLSARNAPDPVPRVVIAGVVIWWIGTLAFFGEDRLDAYSPAVVAVGSVLGVLLAIADMRWSERSRIPDRHPSSRSDGSTSRSRAR